MSSISYENITFPFPFEPYELALRHFKAVEWNNWVVHVIVGVLELIPLINYIIAIFDRIFFDEGFLPETLSETSSDEEVNEFKFEVEEDVKPIMDINSSKLCRQISGVTPQRVFDCGLHDENDFNVVYSITMDTEIRNVMDGLRKEPLAEDFYDVVNALSNKLTEGPCCINPPAADLCKIKLFHYSSFLAKTA